MFRATLVLWILTGTLARGEITGALFERGRLITWGGDVRHWNPDTLAWRVLVSGGGPRGEGGCVVDAGRPDWGIVLQEGTPFGNLVVRRAPRFAPEIIDTGVQMHDCAAAKVLDEEGLAVLHRFAQLRF